MIEREIEHAIVKKLKNSKAIILLGPRQAGKSTVLQLVQEKISTTCSMVE